MSLIVSAAVRLTKPNGETIVIAGPRHHHCYETISALYPELLKQCRHEGLLEEGFVDSGNQFFSREQAYEITRITKQLPTALFQFKAERNENILFSEDLY
jgi:hypothetical protein